jgi:hypothetical protein
MMFIGKHMPHKLHKDSHKVYPVHLRFDDIAEPVACSRFTVAIVVRHLAIRSFVPASWSQPLGGLAYMKGAP